MNKHQFRSLLGVIGGIFFMAGDCLIYCYKGNIRLSSIYQAVKSQKRFLTAVL